MSGLMPFGPLAYQGTIAVPYIVRNFAPTTKDFNFNVPTVWINPTDNFAWMLTSKPDNVADWLPFITGGGDVAFLEGDNGVAVGPGTNGIIHVVGDGKTISIVGTPGTNTMTVSSLVSSSITIAGDTGSINGNSLTVYANQSALNCGSSVSFQNSGTISTLNVTDSSSNTLIGLGAGVLSSSATGCTALGYQALSSITSDTQQVALGAGSLKSVSGGTQNTGCGAYSLNGLTFGFQNSALGTEAALHLVAGSYNSFIGATSGSSYAGSESSNILINNSGVLAENNVMRLGTTGSGSLQVNSTYIAGVIGATQPGTGNLVGTWNSSTEQVTVVPDGASGQVLSTNGSGTLSWTNPSASFVWTDISGTLNPAVAGTGYFAVTTNTTITMPTAPALGATIGFCNASGITLAVIGAAGQTLQNGSTVSGPARTMTSTSAGDSIIFIYNDTTTTWFSVPGSSGNWIST